MCDICIEKAQGWLGWIDLPDRPMIGKGGAWYDLSHTVGPDMPCASIFPSPSFNLIRSLPQDPFNVTEIHMVAHAGTHVDSPLHYFADGPDMRDVPLDRLCGPGVVWHLDMDLDQVIEVADLERCRPLLQEGDILAVDTGWAKRFGTPEYERHPSFSAEAAHWLVDRRIKMLAVDFATPDLVYHRREAGFNWPVHHALLSQGILVTEHITGHARFAGKHAEFIFAALPIIGGDGAPARILGRELAD